MDAFVHDGDLALLHGLEQCVWTLAGARLISSASTRFAKIGPRWDVNSPVFGWKIIVPTTSLGSRSGVNWIRSN